MRPAAASRNLAIAAVLVFSAHAAAAQDQSAYTVGAIPDDLWAEMDGTSWHEGIGCPARDELALVSVPYADFEGLPQVGGLVVAKAQAEAVGTIFVELYEADALQIERMAPVSAYGGSDDASMAANNTSAFNCRTVTGGTRLSEHSYGAAIDVNPIQNPYVKGDTTLPPEGAPFDTAAKRDAQLVLGAPGVVGPEAVAIFAKHGWSWGGDWTSLKDYQHFSVSGN